MPCAVALLLYDNLVLCGRFCLVGLRGCTYVHRHRAFGLRSTGNFSTCPPETAFDVDRHGSDWRLQVARVSRRVDAGFCAYRGSVRLDTVFCGT